MRPGPLPLSNTGHHPCRFIQSASARRVLRPRANQSILQTLGNIGRDRRLGLDAIALGGWPPRMRRRSDSPPAPVQAERTGGGGHVLPNGRIRSPGSRAAGQGLTAASGGSVAGAGPLTSKGMPASRERPRVSGKVIKARIIITSPETPNTAMATPKPM